MSVPLVSRLFSAFERLLVNADGHPRDFACAVLFAGGKPIRLIRLLFFKKNASPRRQLSDRLRGFVARPQLLAWLEAFDTPPRSYVQHLAETCRQVRPIVVLLPIGPDENEVVLRAKSVTQSVGVRFSVLIPETSSTRDSLIDKVRRIFKSAGICTVASEDCVPFGAEF